MKPGVVWTHDVEPILDMGEISFMVQCGQGFSPNFIFEEVQYAMDYCFIFFDGGSNPD